MGNLKVAQVSCEACNGIGKLHQFELCDTCDGAGVVEPFERGSGDDNFYGTPCPDCRPCDDDTNSPEKRGHRYLGEVECKTCKGKGRYFLEADSGEDVTV